MSYNISAQRELIGFLTTTKEGMTAATPRVTPLRPHQPGAQWDPDDHALH